MFARGWTGLAPERIADEIAFLHRRYRMDDLAFQDETFFTHAPRVDALAEQFLSRNLPITWTATLRADQACRLGDDLFAKTVRSGLRRVMVGVESGSQEMLDRLQKDMKLEQVRDDRRDVHAPRRRRHLQLHRRLPRRIRAEHAGHARARQGRCGDRIRSSRRRSSTTGRIPAIRWRSCRAARGYVFPRGLEEWADFDYVGGRGPWITPTQWRTVERFKFYTRHAWKPGAWRWPLRATSQWRCEHDWYALPVEKLIVDFVRPPQQVS